MKFTFSFLYVVCNLNVIDITFKFSSSFPPNFAGFVARLLQFSAFETQQFS